MKYGRLVNWSGGKYPVSEDNESNDILAQVLVMGLPADATFDSVEIFML